MSKYKVGEMVEIKFGSKVWDGKKKIIAITDYGVEVDSRLGIGIIDFKYVKRLRIENWMERII